MLTHFLEPPGQVGERVTPSYVVYQQGACCSAVVRPRYALKGLLAGGVPNLQFDVLLVYLNGPCAEFDTDG